MSKAVRAVLDSVWAFAPNRDTLGGTAYFIVENSRNILVDCPPWTPETQAFLTQQGGVHHLLLTHRQGMSAAAVALQRQFDCTVWVQEQEAYLLPEVAVTPFQGEVAITPTLSVFWTPGYSPGSACVYDQSTQVLFTGRHLLPDQTGAPKPLRTAKTFHWRRQLNSVKHLLERFDEGSLQYLCPGANTGFLRQQRYIPQAYLKLQALDLAALSQMPIGG